MFLVAVILLGALTVPLLGGRLAALADLRVRWALVLPAALALQLVALYLPGLPHGARAGLFVASYPVAGLFLVANRRLPGVLLIGLGGALNLLAMSVNGGVMPASPSALAGAGLDQDPGQFHNSTPVQGAHLAFLGDVLYIPAAWPLSNVFSIGDVLIALGAVWALHRVAGSWPARRGRRATSSGRPGGALSAPPEDRAS
jgi:Family of unknown function (DUF5317)